MLKAATASVQLARFDRLRESGPVPEGPAPGTVFCNVAAETRAAGTEPASQQAFTFLILELHEHPKAGWCVPKHRMWRVLDTF
jgi:hypothetical protein